MTAALPFGILLFGLVCAAPIFVILGLLGMALFAEAGLPLTNVAQLVLAKLNSPTLIAVPFFVIAAAFMRAGGIVRILIEMAEAWVGRARGGLAIVCVVATTIFAAISGSSVATAMAMGTVLVPVMRDKGFDPAFALGTIAAAGTLGVLIPPSLGMILYSVIAEESILRLFLAGVVPGLIQAALFVVWIMVYGRLADLPRSASIPAREFVRRHIRGVPALLIPTVIFVGIYGGFASVSEAAALSAVLAFAVSITIYRSIGLGDVHTISTDGMRQTAAILLIAATALLIGHWVTHTGVTNELLRLIVAAKLEAWQFLLIVNVIMLVLGMFLDGVAVVLITVPLIAGVLEPLGISKVHFAVVVIVNTEIGALTPPIGLNLFVLASISGEPVGRVVRGVAPYIVLMLFFLALVTYVPAISTWLPDLVMGAR